MDKRPEGARRTGLTIGLRSLGLAVRLSPGALPDENEEWRSVPGFDRYEVSSLGRVRRHGSSRPLKACRNGRGYYLLNLSIEGVHTSRTVHSLVADAFLGPRPDGFECEHIDEDQTNNRLSNLQYVTHKKNMERTAGRAKRPTRICRACRIAGHDRRNCSAFLAVEVVDGRIASLEELIARLKSGPPPEVAS